MKDTQEIIDARKHYEFEKRALEDFQERVKEAEVRVGAAYVAIRAAMIARDEKLPQCESVESSRWSAKERRTKMVILRKTPAGTLVVRPIGTGEDCAQKYKTDFSGVFRRTGKFDGFYRLEGVPAEFLPVAK